MIDGQTSLYTFTDMPDESVDNAPVYTCSNCGCKAPARRKKDDSGWSKPAKWEEFACKNAQTRKTVKNVYCAKCFVTCVVTRTLSFPLVKVLDDPEGHFKAAYALEASRRTILANELMRELLRHEVRVAWNMVGGAKALPDGAVRLPKYPESIEGRTPFMHLYYHARALAPELNTVDLTALVRSVQSWYSRHRNDVLINGEAFPCFRYPQPIVTGGVSVLKKIEIVDSCRVCKNDKKEDIKVPVTYPVVTLELGGREFRLRLAGGARHAVHLQTLKSVLTQIRAGEPNVRLGNMSLHGKPCGWAAHRFALLSRDPGSRNKMYTKIMVRIPVTRCIPRRTASDEQLKEVLVVRTNPDMLWFGQCQASTVYTTSGRDVRKRLKAHEKQITDQVLLRKLDRHARRMALLAKDRKMARDRSMRAAITSLRAQVSERHERWMSCWLNNRSRELVDYAKRKNVGIIDYDDSDKSFAPKFPWFVLKTLVSQKAQVEGIEFVDRNPPKGDADRRKEAKTREAAVKARAKKTEDPEQARARDTQAAYTRKLRREYRAEQRQQRNNASNGAIQQMRTSAAITDAAAKFRKQKP